MAVAEYKGAADVDQISAWQTQITNNIVARDWDIK
jgi:hypothetical protein